MQPEVLGSTVGQTKLQLLMNLLTSGVARGDRGPRAQGGTFWEAVLC